MEDFKVVGLLLYGVPGSGKSAIAQALPMEFDINGMEWSLKAMQEGLVGKSEENLRAAIKVAKGLAAPRRLLLIATCNRLDSLPPELEARFGLGSFFFDYPNTQAQAQTWDIWRNQFQLPEQPLPEHDKWVGREIRQCCELAWRLGRPIADVASYIVPECVKRKEELERLRQAASGKFLDATRQGVFTCKTLQTPEAPDQGRAIDLEEASVVVAQVLSPRLPSFVPALDPQPVSKKERIGF